MMKFLLIGILFHIAFFTLLFPIIRLYDDSFITPVFFLTRLTQSEKIPTKLKHFLQRHENKNNRKRIRDSIVELASL